MASRSLFGWAGQGRGPGVGAHWPAGRAPAGRGHCLPGQGHGPACLGAKPGREHPGSCLQIPSLRCHSSWRWRSGVNHCLLLFKAFALLQFHHILNSRAAHAASQLLDLEGRQPHAHGWTRPEPARRARGWKQFQSRSVPDIADRNK